MKDHVRLTRECAERLACDRCEVLREAHRIGTQICLRIFATVKRCRVQVFLDRRDRAPHITCHTVSQRIIHRPRSRVRIPNRMHHIFREVVIQ